MSSNAGSVTISKCVYTLADRRNSTHIRRMLHICSKVSKAIPATREFLARGLNSFTVGRLSDIGIFGKPNFPQIAYDGYKANIECFISATAHGKKVTTATPHAPFPATYDVTVPLPLPRLVFTITATLTPADRARFENSLASEGLVKLSVKDNQTYTLSSPTAKTIRKLSKICRDKTMMLDGYSQLAGLKVILPIYEYIDAFLATNTYSFKQSDVADKESDLDMNAIMRAKDSYYRTGHSSKTKKVSYDEDIAIQARKKLREEEEEDTTPWIDTYIANIPSMVYVAKPSGKPSKVSWGTPSEVPNRGGIVFPYFPGMLAEDSKYIRMMVSQLFFRNMGSETENPRDAYRNFRSEFGTAATTPEGIILSHVLKGIELALDCQGQVFLMFDKSKYLGFTLLGEEFRVYFNGWHEPQTPEDLRQDLALMMTHDDVIVALAKALSACKFVGTVDERTVGIAEVVKPAGILEVLGSVDVEATEKDRVDHVTELIKCLNFEKPYRRLNDSNILWALNALGSRVVDLSDERIFIPHSDWEHVQLESYQILATFGPQSFSLFEPRGTDIRVPATITEDSFFTDAISGKDKTKRLIFYEKNLRACLNDWEQVISSGNIRANVKERAIGSRATVFTGERIKPLWEALITTVEKGRRTSGKGKAGEPRGGEKKKQKMSDTGSGTMADFFGDE